ncbi:MAG: ferritin [Candidatus Cloacimonetes bacterium]|nr:ferritin [Candidatus Cloacimonadota bacterium]
MISKKLEKAINKQINEELFSAYLYTSMQAWFADESLDGMANWMKAQAQEEHYHAMKFFDYLIERGGKVELHAIAKPDIDFGNPLKAFQASLDHERYITKCINEMMDLAIAENDHATRIFLQWYVEEQVEEEASVDTIVQRLSRVGDNMHGIYMLDRELASRTFTWPQEEE